MCPHLFLQEVCLDYGLDEASRVPVEELVRKVEASATLKEAILSTADARRTLLVEAKADQLVQEMARADALTKAAAEVENLASPNIIISEYYGFKTEGGAGDVWPPEKVATPLVMKQTAISALSVVERKALAAAFCTSRLHAHLATKVGSGKKLGSAKSIIAEAIKIFCDDGQNSDKVVMSKSTLNDTVKVRVGCPPLKVGRHELVPTEVTTGILDYMRMLAAHKVPCYHSTVIAAFLRVIDNTPLGLKFKMPAASDPAAASEAAGPQTEAEAIASMDERDWDMVKVDNWYKNHFLGDHKGEVQTGLQLTLDVARGNWCKSENLSLFYNNTRDQLLEVRALPHL